MTNCANAHDCKRGKLCKSPVTLDCFEPRPMMHHPDGQSNSDNDTRDECPPTQRTGAPSIEYLRRAPY